MTLFIAHGPLTNPIGHPVDPWGKLTVVDTNDNSDLPDALILTCCTVDRIRGRVRRGTEEIKLSTKETALLSYLAARPGQEISREELLHRVWGYAEGVMSRAVDFAIRRLRTKIELNPTDPDHVLTVFGTGYIFVPDVPKRATESPVRALADSPPALATASPLSQLILSETDSFVGRGVDLSALDGLLTKHTRLITLTGPGGIGKTRLARHYAAHRGAEFPGGVCFADLSNSTTADSICAVVGGAMNCAASVHAIGETLRSRERNLLILDNLEQVIHAAPDTVGAWLAQSPTTTILVTSREVLRIPGERTYILRPLDAENEGMKLFIDRAEAISPGWSSNAADLPRIADLVRQLDGLPLAIELAAARANLLGVDGILSRLNDRFGLLTQGSRGAVNRQQTLLAAIRWSWDLLSADERDVLAQVSVFRGGFSLDAAEAIVSVEHLTDGCQILDTLQALRNKSLIQAHPQSGHFRLSMLMSIREFAADQLTLLPHQPSVHARHARWYTQISRWEHPMDVELDNILSAHQWACQNNPMSACQITHVAAGLFRRRLSPQERELRYSETVRAVEQTGLAWNANALWVRGTLHMLKGSVDKAIDDLESAHRSAKRDSCHVLAGRILNTLASTAAPRGDFHTAITHLKGALDHFTAGNDPNEAAQTCGYLALVYLQTQQLESAQAILNHPILSQPLAPSIVLLLANARALLGLSQENYPEVEQHLTQTLARIETNSAGRFESLLLVSLALCYALTAQLEKAEVAFRAALELSDRGDGPFLATVYAHLSGLYLKMNQLEEADEALTIAQSLLTTRSTRYYEVLLEVYLAARAGHPYEVPNELLNSFLDLRLALRLVDFPQAQHRGA